MAAVFADESRVAEAIAAEGNNVAIACLNGPANMVISGERPAVDAIVNRLSLTGIRSRRLVVSHAFHSPLMDPILDSFQTLAAQIRYSEPFVAIVSNVTGQIASPGSDDFSGILASAHSQSCAIRGLAPRFAQSWTLSLPRNRSPPCSGRYGSHDRAGC